MSIRSLIAHPRFLPIVLRVDALLTGATALALLAGAGILQPFLQLPAPFLRGAGLSLVPFVAFVFALSRRSVPPRAAVSAVVAINVAWVLASAGLLLAGPFQPSALGTAFVVFQAVVVAALADLGYFGLCGRARAIG